MRLRLLALAPLFALGFAIAPAAANQCDPASGRCTSCAWYEAGCRAKEAGTSLPSFLFKAFLRGGRFYVATVGDWLTFDKPLAGIAGEGVSCADLNVRCAPGLVCLNSCQDGGCEAFGKVCTRGPDQVLVQPASSPCGADNLCAVGTRCVRTCPAGVSCAVTHRCVPEESASPSCVTAEACLDFCGRRGGSAPSGTAVRAACVAGSCACGLREIDPTFPLTACEGAPDERLICPNGTAPGCTLGGCAGGTCAAPYASCLVAPEFGGQCLDDASCANVGCEEGAMPFCDADRRCRCKSFQSGTVACSTDRQCAGISCPAGSAPACAAGSCACAVTREGEVACTTVAQCDGDCPEGYGLACVEGRCACQRSGGTGPVSCQAVADCGGVSCPAGFEKACIDARCACTRTVER